jgi:hypothetical protein
MNPELINLIVNLGGTGILIWLVMEMRAEAKAEREWQREMLTYFIQKDDPAFDPQSVKPNHKSGV